MPGDPAILKGVPTALSPHNLLKAVAVKLPCSGLTTSRCGSFRQNLSSDWREKLWVKPSLISAFKLWCRNLLSKSLNSLGTLPNTSPIIVSRTDCSRCSLSTITLAEAIANLPLTGNMQPFTLMSRMLGLLPASHKPCFFLRAAFLKRLPADVRAHLVHDRTSDPLTLVLHADDIFQSHVFSFSAVNHLSAAPVLGEEFPIHAVSPQAVPHAPHSATPGPSSCRAPSASSAYHRSDSPSLCWYHRSHGDQDQ